MDIQLSVIIVNYNGQRFFKDCFTSLTTGLSGIAYEVIVVDNNSSDESCAYLKQYYPEVVLIESAVNLGFGGGNNEGVKNAKGKYLLLLNNDTILQDNISGLLKVLEQDTSVGAIGINMLNGEGSYLKAAGNFPSPLNLFRIKNIFWLGADFRYGDFKKDVYEVDWITGSFMLMPKGVYEKVSGFDEDYFLYVEDVDLCRRIAYAGYKRIFMPRYNYIHFVGYNSAKDPLVIRGYELYIQKHSKGIYKLLMQFSLNINKLVKRIKKLK